MNDQAGAGLSTGQERALLTEFAEVVVTEVAPEELLLFSSTTAEFFEDPNKVIRARRRDEPVGFGLDMALVSPYVLAIAGPALTYLLSVAADTIKEGSKTLVGEWVRGLFKRRNTASGVDANSADKAGRAEATAADNASSAEATARVALTVGQARRLHDIAYERAIVLGLPDDRAALLADAVVGGVQVAE